MVKAVSFKDKKEKDLIDYVEGKDFSYYVKDLIRKDMKENDSKENAKSNKINKKRNVNFDI